MLLLIIQLYWVKCPMPMLWHAAGHGEIWACSSNKQSQLEGFSPVLTFAQHFVFCSDWWTVTCKIWLDTIYLGNIPRACSSFCFQLFFQMRKCLNWSGHNKMLPLTRSCLLFCHMHFSTCIDNSKLIVLAYTIRCDQQPVCGFCKSENF